MGVGVLTKVAGPALAGGDTVTMVCVRITSAVDVDVCCVGVTVAVNVGEFTGMGVSVKVDVSVGVSVGNAVSVGTGISVAVAVGGASVGDAKTAAVGSGASAAGVQAAITAITATIAPTLSRRFNTTP